jgi:dipeptidyl aminopeptidase/acylaminoacyl peptidase
MQLLTPEDADHNVSFSGDGRFFADSYSRVDLPPVSVLRRADGSLVMGLEKSDVSKLVASGWKQPERFKAKGRDGKTDVYGVLWRPGNFDPAKKYAVVEQIYAGPQSFFAPATFAAYRHACQAFAELGFLCIMVDGMGTDGRSHAFHAVAHKNLGDGGLPDHIAAMKELAARYPFMDLTRVGVFGHSAGGYNSTNALLTHPEFYKVAVSSAGNHDHRLDKAGWVEQWMGYPAGKWYEEQSNITLAPRLQGKLMLAVGEVDDNVTPVSTLKVAAALVEADKDFDLMIIPNTAHGFGNSDSFARRRWDFFVRHLLGVTPPAFKFQPRRQ